MTSSLIVYFECFPEGVIVRVWEFWISWRHFTRLAAVYKNWFPDLFSSLRSIQPFLPHFPFQKYNKKFDIKNSCENLNSQKVFFLICRNLLNPFRLEIINSFLNPKINIQKNGFACIQSHLAYCSSRSCLRKLTKSSMANLPSGWSKQSNVRLPSSALVCLAHPKNLSNMRWIKHVRKHQARVGLSRVDTSLWHVPIWICLPCLHEFSTVVRWVL